MIDNQTVATQATDEIQIRRPSFWQIADDLMAYTETAAMVEAQLAEAKGEDRPLLVAEQAEIQQRIEQLGCRADRRRPTAWRVSSGASRAMSRSTRPSATATPRRRTPPNAA